MVGMTRKKTLFWLCIFLLPNLLGFLILLQSQSLARLVLVLPIGT